MNLSANPIKIDSALLQAARVEYEVSLNDDNRQVRDPIMTPFAWAMKAAGYTPVTRPGGCVSLRECPFCKSKHSTQYTKADSQAWGCPHCQRISIE